MKTIITEKKDRAKGLNKYFNVACSHPRIDQLIC